MRTQLLWWGCTQTWSQASRNTLWCVAGCSFGEFGTLGAYQLLDLDPMSSFPLMALPLLNGLATSVGLETLILARRYPVSVALKTALRMSFVSMLAMEGAMEGADYALTGGMTLQIWAIPWMLLSGFFVPLPYNYWRLKKLGRSCH